MIHGFIEYNSIFGNIKGKIEDYCYKFQIEFEKEKIKNKREIVIYFSIKEILKHLKENKNNKLILFYNKEFDNPLFHFCFKKISKILNIPIFFNEKDFCNGKKKEFLIKSNNFYENNVFSIKNLKKEFFFKQHEELLNEIISLKTFKK